MKNTLPEMLRQFKDGRSSEDKLLHFLKDLPYQDLEFAKVDHHRILRQGFSEVIFGRGKTIKQILAIAGSLLERHENLLITSAPETVFPEIQKLCSEAQHFPASQLISVQRDKIIKGYGRIAVISAGTTDISVAEEAAVTAQFMGNEVVTSYDCGVAGIHRLLDLRKVILDCSVIVAVAGMEGALPSVVGGLAECPVIAVPTSVGYGAAFKGVTALLSMLNSCSPNVTVVNIDNGFGAGFVASLINRSQPGRER